MVEGVYFPMLSDPGGKIGTLYGVYDRDKGVDSRGHFLIDPDGRIQVIEIVTDPRQNIGDIASTSRPAHLRATGDFMPCGWQPGKPTLPREPDPKKQAGEVWKTWKTKNAF
jgi:peroxiredoxin (alkyl hydroperoxide reductase subunit C)